MKLFSDSQATIRGLSSTENISLLVREGRNSTDKIGTKDRLFLVWAPGHTEIVESETADELGAS